MNNFRVFLHVLRLPSGDFRLTAFHISWNCVGMGYEGGMSLIRLCGVDEVALGQAKVFQLAGRKIALFHRSQGYFALDDHCPHRSGPLSEGWIENEEIVCPWHQWSFKLADGQCSNIPGSAVQTFPVTIKENAVWVKT